jgi:outer membrane protein TolC
MSRFTSSGLFVSAIALVACAAALSAEPASSDIRKVGLDEAVRLALEKNFLVKVDAFNPAIARAHLTEAWGQYDLKIVGSYQEGQDEMPALLDPTTGLRPAATITKSNSGSLALQGALPIGTTFQFGGTTANERLNTSAYADNYVSYAGVRVTQPLFRDFGLNPGLFQIRIARTNLAISDWEYRASVTNVVTQVMYAYSNLHLARAYLGSAKRSRDMTVQLCRENEGRRQRGAMSEYDVLSARARVADREESVIKAERNVQLAENALKQLISDERDPSFLNWHVEISALPAAAEPPSDTGAVFREALAQRPDYRSAKLGVKLSDLERRYYRNQLLPRVDLQGSYGYNGVGSDFTGSRTDVRNKDYNSFTTGVSVSIPVTSAAERGKARAAKLRLRQAQTDLERLEQDILISVSNAAQQLDSTRRRVATTRTARELNEKMLDAEWKRLRAGTGSTFNVLYQQEQLSYAEIAAAEAEADQLKAQAEFDRQTGRTLVAHNIDLATK